MAFDARSEEFKSKLEIKDTSKIPEVIKKINEFITDYNSASDKTAFKKCILVTYTVNIIAGATIRDSITEASCILAGSFNPPHYEHVKLMKDCSDFFESKNKKEGEESKKPDNIFELSIVNADKGTIDVNDLAARLLYFTQPILGGESKTVNNILFAGSEGKTFYVAVTATALFSEKKEILLGNPNSVFCAGIDTVERIIMPKYYDLVKESWNKKEANKSLTGITEAEELKVDDNFYSTYILDIPLYVVGRTVNGVREYLSTEYVFEYEGEYKSTKKNPEDIAKETALRTQKNEEKAKIMEKLKSGELKKVLSEKFTIVTTKDGTPLIGDEVASSNIRETPEFKELDFRVDRYLLDIDNDFQPILSNFNLSSAWIKRFIFSKASYQSIGIGFVGTGGGANLFDYLFRSGSSAAMVFADFEYHQNASYEYCKEAIQDIATINEKSELIKSDGNKLSFVSTIFSNSLAVAGVKKLLQINVSINSGKFKKLLTIACSADYSNPRFCISLIDGDKNAETYAYAYKGETNQSRDKVSNTIVIEILRVLCNYIYNINVEESHKHNEKLSFTKLDNKDKGKLLLLGHVDDKFTETQLDLVFKTTGGKKKKSTRRKRNKFNSKSRRAF